MSRFSGATILTPQQLAHRRVRLPSIWKKAAGLLKDDKLDSVKEQQKLRAEWDNRWERQLKLARRRG